MAMFVFCLLIVSLSTNIAISSGSAKGPYEYNYSLRRNVLEEEECRYSGNNIKLNEDEQTVNAYLEYMKWKEFNATRGRFSPARPIERVLGEIKTSEVYRILKKFPKGGNTHIHQNHILSKKKMLDMVFDSPDLLNNLCVNTEGYKIWRLNFYKSPPHDWVKVTSNTTLFSKETLLQHLTLITSIDANATSNPTDSAYRWKLLNPLFSRAGASLVFYANYTAMHLQALFQSAMEENVQYLETRASGYGMYVLDNTSVSGHHYMDISDGDSWMNLLRTEIALFKTKHPEFIGLKEIINGHRWQQKSQIKQSLQRAIRLRQRFPDIVGGFDLVAQEDKGYSLLFFIDDLSNTGGNITDEIPFYFHTAETNWPRDLLTAVNDDDPVSSMENIYEAILLGSKRIGHGLGFIRHPYLMKVLKEKKIAIEANPVSNMLLGYVADQRHHPAATYIRSGIPVVLGSDDPGTMGYDEFTVDWYEAFMGWGLTLRDLKRLAMNSLEYSTMTSTEKITAFQKWNDAYVKFVSEVKHEACQAIQSKVQPEVHSIFPSAGFVTNSTKIKVFGRYFQTAICKTIVCKFGIYESNGQYIYNNMLTCNAPATNDVATTFPFSISMDSGATFIRTNLTFTYMAAHSSVVDPSLIG